MEQLLSLFISALLSLFVAGGEVTGAELPTLDTTTGVVVSVIDGDTIDVQLGSTVERVRYIGIDTPEPYRDGKPACYSREATERNRGLVEGQTVTLKTDAEDRDRFGRLLRYVYSDEVLVNEVLLTEGYATTLSIPPNTTYAQQFAAAEREAREQQRGLWGVCQS